MEAVSCRKNKKASNITMTDFMRIQNTIIPSNAEYEDRRERERSLKTLSSTKAFNWPDSIEMKKKTEFESHKKKFIDEEMVKRKIDEEEKKFQVIQNNLVVERARRLLFEQQDPVKSFNAKLMYSDMLKERDYQKEIVERKKDITKKIEKTFFDIDLKKMEEFDRKEAEKKEIELQMRINRMNVINEQLLESKIKRIKDHQEKMVEGHMMKIATQKAIEEDKKIEEEIQRQKENQREEFKLANKKLEMLKQEMREKEKEEERKIEQFAIKKQQILDLKAKVEGDKFKEKQAQKQKLIDKQIEYLQQLKTKEDEILAKSIKEAEEKKKLAEKIKKERFDSQMQGIKDQREYVKKKKEEEAIQLKKEEMEFVEDWKRKMKQLEADEREEKRLQKERDRNLAEYQHLQFLERRKLAQNDFIQNNEDSYKTKYMLSKDSDDFITYAEMWIKEYHKQGKDITPLLLELKRYKKNSNIA